MESLLAQSDALFEVKRFGSAAERASDAARQAPGDPRAYWAWSRALRGNGQFAESARMADESIRLAPEAAQGFRLRSIALVVTGPEPSQGRAGPSSAPRRWRVPARPSAWLRTIPTAILALAEALP